MLKYYVNANCTMKLFATAIQIYSQLVCKYNKNVYGIWLNTLAKNTIGFPSIY